MEATKHAHTNSDIGLGSKFLYMTPKANATEAIINKWNYIKLNSICTSKETIYKGKRQFSEWEKIFANHKFHKKANVQNMQ